MTEQLAAPTSIRLPVALTRRLAAEAKRLDRPASWIIRKAVEAYLNRKGTES